MGEYADDALDEALNDYWPGWRDPDDEIDDVLPSYPVKHHFGTVRAEADDGNNHVDEDDDWDVDDEDEDYNNDSWMDDEDWEDDDDDPVEID